MRTREQIICDAAGDGEPCDSGHFDRTLCPEPCGYMHSYCSACGKRQDECANDLSERDRRTRHGTRDDASAQVPLEELRASMRLVDAWLLREIGVDMATLLDERARSEATR